MRPAASTRTTWGMISPAFATTTVSPTRTSSRAIWSALWRLARATVLPDSSTGSSSATGVSLPVLPTWITMSRSSGHGLLGLVLEGDAPPRALAPDAEPAPLAVVVDLDDEAVGLVADRVPQVVPVLDVAEDVVEGAVDLGEVGDGDAPDPEQLGDVTQEPQRVVISPRPWATKRSRREPQSFGSRSFRVPAAAFRGFANFSSRVALSRANSALSM